MKFDYICIDFQSDFVDIDGKNYIKGASVDFIKNTLFPLFTQNDIKVSEILSDYRLPRGKSKNQSCVPGTKGYESLLPNNLRKGNPWIKCMHNPLWVRDNIGVANAPVGNLYQNPQAFNEWVEQNIFHQDVILFGETAECCLLQTASELYFRGFNVYYIYEATDPMNERLEYKDNILYHSTTSIYVKTIRYKEFLNLMGGN